MKIANTMANFSWELCLRNKSLDSLFLETFGHLDLGTLSYWDLTVLGGLTHLCKSCILRWGRPLACHKSWFLGFIVVQSIQVHYTCEIHPHWPMYHDNLKDREVLLVVQCDIVANIQCDTSMHVVCWHRIEG
jgi:hypothetical protein